MRGLARRACVAGSGVLRPLIHIGVPGASAGGRGWGRACDRPGRGL